MRAHAHRRRLATAALFAAVAAVGTFNAVAGRAPTPSSSLPPEAFQRVAVAPGTATSLGPVASAWAAPRSARGVPEVAAVPTIDAVPTVVAAGTGGPAPDPGGFVGPQVQATPAPSLVPAQTPPPGPVHTVRQGDSLWTIAAMHDVPLATVARWNPGVDPASLRIGSKVLVPGGRIVKPAPKLAPKPAPKPAPMPAPMPAPKPAPKPAPRPSTPDHRWPLAVRGVVTTTFSSRHPGIDIAAPAGTAIRAVAAGVVIWAGWKDNGGGFVVVVRHPDGMISTYNHSRGVLVSVGERVVGGQRIAEVGSTGNSTGPHLDVRIEMGGRFVNPLALF